jgi:hypothetical protein
MNKRRFTRVEFTGVALITFDGTTFQGKVANLSLHGVLVRTDQSVPIGSSVDIAITLPSREPEMTLRLKATAVRTGPDGISFEFNAMDSDSFTHLYVIVSSVSGDPDAIMDEFAAFAEQNIKVS